MIPKGIRVKDSRVRVKCYAGIIIRASGKSRIDSVCELETRVLLLGDLNYANKEYLKALKDDKDEIERMLKESLKSVENKHLDP